MCPVIGFGGIEYKEWNIRRSYERWMITYQDVRGNMCEAEKIYANDKVSTRRIEEENEKKRLENTYNSHKTRGKMKKIII